MPQIAALFNDFSPTRHAHLDLPNGWIDAKMATQLLALETAKNAQLHAFVALFDVPKDRFHEGCDVPAYAKILRDHTEAHSSVKLDERKSTELAESQSAGQTIYSWDTTGLLNGQHVHYRRIVLQTPTRFVHLVCWAKEDDFAEAAKEFEKLPEHVREVE
jgi:hypothetical protein